MSDLAGWTCPLPLRDYPRVVLGHGGGGQLSAELVEHLFIDEFGEGVKSELHDGAIITADDGKLAFSTDSYVVRPLFFPGGSIGDLAINGTVNDVSMCGARPIALSAGFILEEGLEMETLGRVVRDMALAARRAGIRIVTGDTKVVESGHADGLYINTAGLGVVPQGVDIRPTRAAPGDVVIVSGPIGLHGVAVLSQREGLEFGTTIQTDSAPLNGLVADMVGAVPDIHVLRDPTRGGLAATLCELATAANVGIAIEEDLVPVPTDVASACAFLGLDPMAIANEGRLVAIVAESDLDTLIKAMHNHPHGKAAQVIGRVRGEHPGVVTARTRFGSHRIVDLPLGEVLPRIC